MSCGALRSSGAAIRGDGCADGVPVIATNPALGYPGADGDLVVSTLHNPPKIFVNGGSGPTDWTDAVSSGTADDLAAVVGVATPSSLLGGSLKIYPAAAGVDVVGALLVTRTGALAPIVSQASSTAGIGAVGFNTSGGSLRGFLGYVGSTYAADPTLADLLALRSPSDLDFVIADSTRIEHRFGLGNNTASYQLSNGESAGLSAAATLRLTYNNSLKRARLSVDAGQYVTIGVDSMSTTAVKTSNYDAAFGDFVRVDPSGGAFAVTLPALSAARVDQVIGVKNVTSSATAVTVNPTGADTIDGAASSVVASGFGMLWFRATSASTWAVY